MGELYGLCELYLNKAILKGSSTTKDKPINKKQEGKKKE